MLWDRCLAICVRIALGSRVRRLARDIANRIHDLIAFETRGFRDDVPFYSIAAASVYMASHLCGEERTLELVARCVDGVEDRAVGHTYALLFTHRLQIIGAEMLADTGVDLDRIDERLPPLSSLAGVQNGR